MPFDLILMMVALFAIMYFLMIRPQQKKMKAAQEMQASLGVGSRVLLTSGIFATIAHVGERQMIVELAPGLEVTILKGNVARKVTPEDEEFEFTDEADDAADVASYDVPDDASSLVAEEELTFDPTPEADTDEPEARPEDKN